jgi:glutamate formiminotransferase
LIKISKLKAIRLVKIKPDLSKKYIHAKKITTSNEILIEETFSLITLISNLKERNIKITDKIVNAVVIANGKSEPKGLNVLAS